MNANGRLFNSIKDRTSITEAYEKVSSAASSSENSVTALDFIKTEYPSIPDETLNFIDERIFETVEADDYTEPFVYDMPDITIGYHTENDGIGSYEYWGHMEYDHGHDFAVADDVEETISDTTPEGTVLEFDDDYDRLSEIANEDFQYYHGNEGNHKHGFHSSTKAVVRYRLMVSDATSFKNYIEALAAEHNLPLSDAESKDAIASDGSSDEIHESDTLKRSPAEVIQDGPDEQSDFEDTDTLDGRINLRGKASDLRDYEVERGSHFANILACYNDNKVALEKLEKDLEHEGLYKLSSQVSHILFELESEAENAEEKLSEYQRKVRRQYHVGSRYGFMSRPNYVGHERFSL